MFWRSRTRKNKSKTNVGLEQEWVYVCGGEKIREKEEETYGWKKKKN